MDPDVLAQRRHGAVPGLVGDRPVARPPQVGVGDKAGPQRVRRVGEGVDAGALDGSLYQVVDGLGAEAAGDGPVAGGNGPEDGAGADAASSAQLRSARTGQRAGLGPMGRTTSSGSVPSWLVLERGMVTTRPWGWSFTSSKSRATSSDRRSAPTNPTSNRALSRAPARSGSGGRPGVAQVLVSGQASRTSRSSGGMRGAACSAGAPWVRRIPSQTATTRAAPVGSGSPLIRKAKRMADRRLAIVPTLAPAPARKTRYLEMAAASPPSGSRPSRAHHEHHSAQSLPVALERVGGPGGGHVGALVVAEGDLVDQVERARRRQRAAVHGPRA